jgi:hypothetical protein
VQVNLVDIAAEQQQRSATMLSLLVQLCKKRALLLLHMCEESNGYEAVRRYEAGANKMLPGQNRSLAFEVADAKANPWVMMEKIEEFEHTMEQHDATIAMALDDEVKMAVIMRGIPEGLKAEVYSNPMSLDTYEKVRSRLVSLIIGRKLHTRDPSASEHASMEVDALKGWKSKGKSKGKDDGGKFGKGGSLSLSLSLSDRSQNVFDQLSNHTLCDRW